MKDTIVFKLILGIVYLLLVGGVVKAQPYGAGKYNENVPYGSATSIAITTSGTVTISITPTGGGTESTNNDSVNVTTTDVAGYTLNLKDSDATTNLVFGGNTITPVTGSTCPATPAALGSNTWGYRLAAYPAGYCAIKANATAGDDIKTTTGPATSGDATAVTYGAKVTTASPSGTYTDTVTYTAIGNTP